MTSEQERERWKRRTAFLLLPKGELVEVKPVRIPELGFPGVLDFEGTGGNKKLFIPSFKWFRCVECAFCQLHVRRENVKDHLRRHDETQDRRLIRDEYKVGSHHRVLPGQQKLMV
jgi:hypothetical protein